MNDTAFPEELTDNDFIELLIRHMTLMSDVVTKAKTFNLTGADLMLGVYGCPLYKELIDIILKVDNSPIQAYTLVNSLKHKFESKEIGPELKKDAMALLEYIYSGDRPLEEPEFFDGKLSSFIKKKRAAQLISLYKDDIETLTRELNKLNVDFNGESALSRPRIISPFSQLICKTRTSMIGSGLVSLDAKIDGLLLGEYAQLIGFSGGGKTAVGCNMVVQSAEVGRPSAYISCEEHEEDLSQRAYSRVYRIPYRQLRKGLANLELESKFNDELQSKKQEMLAKNLKLIGLKGVSNINANFLYEVLVQEFERTGFIPELVMLDQMQFISAVANVRKGAAPWEAEEVVSAELDELSHKPIGNSNFVLWVQHQAKGKTKAIFTRDDIDGFKGIVHKSDLTVGVGRANEKSDEINLFSLKVRHCADFTVKVKTEFEYMNVTATVVRDTLAEFPSSNNGGMTVINNTPIVPHT